MKGNNKGFSLVELLIAIAVSSLVMLTMLALWSYATNQMAKANQKVQIQNEAKDIMNHIITNVQEGSEAEYREVGYGPSAVRYLKVVNNSDDVPDNKKEIVYWNIGNKIYYASTDTYCSASNTVTIATLSSDDTHLLGDYVDGFVCDIKENAQSKTKYIDVKLDMKATNETVTMSASDKIYMRNQ